LIGRHISAVAQCERSRIDRYRYFHLDLASREDWAQAMIEQIVTVPAYTRLDIDALEAGTLNTLAHGYQLRKKSAGQWFWRRRWEYRQGQAYIPGARPSKTEDFNFTLGVGHTFLPEPRPFRLWFKVWSCGSAPEVEGCVSSDDGLSVTGPHGEEVCRFDFHWNRSGNMYVSDPSSVQFWPAV
jgi:hypothetical protein